MTKKTIKFGLPNRIEMILVALLLVTIFFIDVNNNKIIDNGLNYQTTWFGGVTSFATTNFWLGLFLYFFLFLALMIMALQMRKTHAIYDAIISMIAVFGLSFIVGGHFLDLYNVNAHFLGLMFPAVNFYHIGIAIVIGMPVLLAATD